MEKEGTSMRIGTVEINSQLALAPMAGVTDWAFRCVCLALGAAVTVTCGNGVRTGSTDFCRWLIS